MHCYIFFNPRVGGLLSKTSRSIVSEEEIRPALRATLHVFQFGQVALLDLGSGSGRVAGVPCSHMQRGHRTFLSDPPFPPPPAITVDNGCELRESPKVLFQVRSFGATRVLGLLERALRSCAAPLPLAAGRFPALGETIGRRRQSRPFRKKRL